MMCNAMQLSTDGSKIAVNALTAYAIWKTVDYFINAKKGDAMPLINDAWNKGKCILIGHDSSGRSALKALVDSEDYYINEKTFNRVQRRFSDIKAQFGDEADVEIHLRTPGGELFFAMLIAHLIYEWKGTVTAHIHSYSASGGTLIALACDKVVMDNESVLGPIDPQAPKESSYHSLTNFLRAHDIDPNAIDKDFQVDAKKMYPMDSTTNKDVYSTKKTGEEDAENAAGAEDAEQAEETTHRSAKESLVAVEARMRLVDSIDMLRTYKKFLERILSKNYAKEAIAGIIDSFWVGRHHSSPIWRPECIEMGLHVVKSEI